MNTINQKQYNPTFNALYFKNNKVQNVVSAMSEFTSNMRCESVIKTIKNHNVVIDCNWWQHSKTGEIKDVEILATGCTNVIQKGRNILPSGLVTLTTALSRGIDSRILDKEDVYNKLYFYDEETRNQALNDSDLLTIISKIEHLVNDLSIIINNKDNRLSYILCENIKQNKNKIEPDGFYLRRSPNYSPMTLENWEQAKNTFQDLTFKNDKVKRSFLDEISNKMQFLFSANLEQNLCKYYVLIDSAVGDLVKFYVCTDIVQVGKDIKPAGIVSELFTSNEGNIGDQVVYRGCDYLDIMTDITGETSTKVKNNPNIKELFLDEELL